MKARGMAVQASLAAVGLLAAYLTWQTPKESAKAEVVTVLTATKQSLEKVRFDDGTRFVEVLKRGPDEGESRPWVTLGYLPGKTPVVDAGFSVVSMDGGVDAGVVQVTVRPAEPPPTRLTPANDRAEGLLGRFEPLQATRALGKLPADKLDELGLVGQTRTLEVTVAGQTSRFTISHPLPGIIGTYVMDEKQQVYLVQGTLFSDLDPTSQVLVDRRLHVFKPADFDGFSLTLDGKTVAFVQSGAEVPSLAKVARAATPDQPDELAKNWHEKMWTRLVVTDVLGKGELPKSGAPVVAMRLDYTARGAKKGFLELGFDPAKATWVRTENTGSWVAVHQGSEELMLEAKRLLK